MWPWSPRVGFFTSAVLLTVLVGVVVVASVASSWPSERLEPWVFLAAVLVALVPLGLVLIDFAADRRGTLGITRFFSVDFSAGGPGNAVGSGQARSIAPNIVASGTDIADSGREEMRSALEYATESAVVEIDLASGSAWWRTRLLVLAAGGARLGRPGAISFLAKDRGRDRVFHGWADPGELLEQMLRRDPQLRFVYWYAQRVWAGQFALTSQQAYEPYWQQVDPDRIRHYAARQASYPPAPAAQPANQVPRDVAPEMLLANELAVLEPPERGISVVDLQELAGPILHRDVIELTDPPEVQIDTALRSRDRFIAVTEQGDYQGLAEVETIVRDLLRSTIAALADHR